MQVREVIETLGLKLMTHEVPVDVDVIGGYASDLLSNVMGQAAPGMIWVTMQGHQNIAAVASLIGLSAVIDGRRCAYRRGYPEKSRTERRFDIGYIFTCL